MVLHVLKDGTRPEDITGHVVKVRDAEVVYNLMDEMNRRAKREESDRNN